MIADRHVHFVLSVAGGCFSAGFDLKALSDGQLAPDAYDDPEHGDNAGMVRLFFLIVLFSLVQMWPAKVQKAP